MDILFHSKTFFLGNQENIDKGQLAVRVICCICMGYYGIYELVQLWYFGVIRYFDSLWNMTDVGIIAVYFGYAKVAFNNSDNDYLFKAL